MIIPDNARAGVPPVLAEYPDDWELVPSLDGAQAEVLQVLTAERDRLAAAKRRRPAQRPEPMPPLLAERDEMVRTQAALYLYSLAYRQQRVGKLLHIFDYSTNIHSALLELVGQGAPASLNWRLDLARIGIYPS